LGCGILFTMNRNQWIVVALVMLFVGIKQERLALALSILLVALAVTFVHPLHERFDQLIHFTQNASDRDVIWRGAFMIFFDRPIFGFGLQTFSQIFPLFAVVMDKGISSWHCDYLQVYFEGGIIGLAALVWLWIAVFTNAVKILKQKTLDLFYRNLTFSIMLGMSAFTLMGVWGGFVNGLMGTLLFEFLLGMLALIAVTKREHSK